MVLSRGIFIYKKPLHFAMSGGIFTHSSKGQAAAAAVLIAILAGVIIAFVILISPADREALLNNQELPSLSGNGDGGYGSIERVLIEEFPGRVDFLRLNEVEHSLASVRIYTGEESNILAEKFSAYMKNGVFSDEDSTFTFRLDDLDNVEDVVLTFGVASISGNLKILWNGEEIFNRGVAVDETPVVPIPSNLLRQSNELIFSVSSPGVAFWKSNFAELSSIQIVGEVTQLSLQSARNTFLISETEYNNLDSLELHFQPECVLQAVGKLTVKVNSVPIYSGVPDCGLSLVPVEFSRDIIRQGENTLEFFTDRGQYELFHVKVISELEEIEYPTYYFELSSEEFDDIETGDFDVEARIEFIDDTSRKVGYISINNHILHFDTRNITYTEDISDDIVRGNNAIVLKPSRTLEVREFRVDLRD